MFQGHTRPHWGHGPLPIFQLVNARYEKGARLVVNEKVNVKRKFVWEVRAMLHDWEVNGLAAADAKHFIEKPQNRGCPV